MRSPCSIGDVGACWDNAVVGRFFGSLKQDWLIKIQQPTREQMRRNVVEYMRYYNLERLLQSANCDHSPVSSKIYQKKRPILVDQNIQHA